MPEIRRKASEEIKIVVTREDLLNALDIDLEEVFYVQQNLTAGTLEFYINETGRRRLAAQAQDAPSAPVPGSPWRPWDRRRH